ncbi:MAG: polymerase, sigma-24 subunit, subfamily [Crocinitomicaceae bacterium]|jgi:RNA polymerase sigma-70 factor (ECF subfamily)|nr:polymerase, sigma-24 subunit, subfamily [Crocinitomicaceae bacterium]
MFSFKRNKYRQLSDAELTQALKLQQDKAALSVIYERYSHLVLGTCLKYLKDEAEAQDLTSKIFEELVPKIVRHEISYFKAWLYQLVKNECLMHLRKNQYLFVRNDFAGITTEASTEDKHAKERKMELLEEAIEQLNQEQADSIRLFYLENKSYAEISLELKLDLNKVKSYIQNGKRNLKNLLLQHEEFEQK